MPFEPKVEYRIITDNNIKEMMLTIELYLANDWLLAGGVSICAVEDKIEYAQAVYRNVPVVSST